MKSLAGASLRLDKILSLMAINVMYPSLADKSRRANLLVAVAATSLIACRPIVPATSLSNDAKDYIIQQSTGYVAHIHRPSMVGPQRRGAAVILIGGSGGGIGWQDYMAERL